MQRGLSFLALATALSACDESNAPGRPANAVDVTFDFCASGPPDWFAYQDSGRAWVSVPVTASSRSVTFPATPTVGVAMATESRFGTQTVEIFYLTAAEVEELGCINDVPTGSRQVFAPFLRQRASDNVVAWLAGGIGSTQETPTGSTLSIEGVPATPTDLLSVMSPSSDSFPVMVILRHDLSPANGDTLSLLDFTSAEARPRVHAHVDVTGNTGGNALSVITTFVSAHRSIWTNVAYSDAADTGTAVGVDGSQLGEGDYQRVAIYDERRSVWLYMHALHDTTAAFGAPLGVVDVDTVSTSPSLRLRMRVPAGAYTSFAEANFGGGGKVASVLVTSGFLGQTPETWDITVPELPQPIASRMPQPGVSMFELVVGYEGRLGLRRGDAAPNPGDFVRAALGFP